MVTIRSCDFADHQCRTYLVAGTPPSALASHCIVAVLSPPEDEDIVYTEVPVVFKSHTRSLAQKIQESIGTEKPGIARPAREAKELLRRLDDSLF
jgi:hypothetical protein